MDRVLPLGRLQALTNKLCQIFLQQLGTTLLCHSAPIAGLAARNLGSQRSPSAQSPSSKLQPLMSRQQSKNATFHTEGAEVWAQASILMPAIEVIDLITGW